MKKEKTTSIKSAVIHFFKGDYTDMNVTLTEGISCKVKEDSPTPTYLFKFVQLGKEIGNNVLFQGQSKTPRLSITNREIIEDLEKMGQIILLRGYNDLNNEPMCVIRSLEYHNGGESANE